MLSIQGLNLVKTVGLRLPRLQFRLSRSRFSCLLSDQRSRTLRLSCDKICHPLIDRRACERDSINFRLLAKVDSSTIRNLPSRSNTSCAKTLNNCCNFSTFSRTLVTSATCAMDSTEDLMGIAVVEDVQCNEERKEYPWKRSKKMAAMLSFSGKNYYGMQRNPGPDINTIEDELLKALAKSGAIDPEWETSPQKAFFTRASRTDKGVSAARMVVSLKMILDPPSLADINSHLPSDIRLQQVVRATKNFNCQSSADARTYLYLLPTLAFAPCEEVVTEAWRCKPDTISKVNDVLKCYIGSHFFHNYTSAKLPMEPSSRRFMQEVEAGPPFEKHGMEWSVIKVKGQSFMLHQIRKMIGLALAIVRGHTSLATLESAWGGERIDIPRAPGLGLMLDTIHYERYNKRYGEDGQHDRLDWVAQHEDVEKFKEDFIFGDIMKTEIEEKSMLLWLGQVLPLHTFTPRHFESEDSEPQPLSAAAREIARDRGAKKAAGTWPEEKQEA